VPRLDRERATRTARPKLRKVADLVPPERQLPVADSGGSTRAADIEPKRIRWLWTGRLAIGYLSLWTGEEGLGKSTFACRMFAEATHGRMRGQFADQPFDVLVVADEDAREDTWVPRLMAVGADLNRVRFLDVDDGWNVRDGLSSIGTVLTEHPDIKLVFVDSIFEHLPGAGRNESINSPDFIRHSLKSLRRLCREHNVAGLISTHPPKSGGGTFHDHVMASSAFVQVVRIGLMFAWHPDDLELPNEQRRRVFLRGKGNIGRDPGAQEFSVVGKWLEIEGEQEEQPYVDAYQPSDVTFRRLTTPAKMPRLCLLSPACGAPTRPRGR
jgi:AAA domain